MLRVTRLGPSMAAGYYVGDLASELAAVPAAGRGSAEAPGHWWGTAAAGLGLEGRVVADDLEAVLAGRHPVTGRAMTTRRGSAAGYDLTFAAPKSVSVVFALGTPDQSAAVLAAHRTAVDAALGYVAAHAVAARRSGDGDTWLVPVDGPVTATFGHGVSRALDPHLHSHAVVANVVHGADGRWTALDGRGLFAHAAAAGQAYQAELRRRLTEDLGARWTPRRNGAYELAGSDPVVLGAFSGRAAEIHQALGSGPVASRRARAVAWAATRSSKTADRTPAELRSRWRAMAEDVGVEPLEVDAGDRARSGAATVDEHRFARLARTPHAGATRRDALAAWAGSLAAGASVVEAERCVEALADWGPGIGVGERSLPLAGLVPSPHLLGALGPRPSSHPDLVTWLRAATSLDRYRQEWSVDRAVASTHPLGVAGGRLALARLPAKRLAHHLATERELAEARRRLGRDRGREPGSLDLGLGLG